MYRRTYGYVPGRMSDIPRRSGRRAKRHRKASRIFRLALVCLVPVVVLLMLCVGLPARSESETGHSAADGSLSVSEDSPSHSEVPEQEADAVPPSSVPVETDDASEQAYDYSAPVPESDPVEEDYFDDAVFIGDSRTEGLLLNTGLSNATFYVHKGLMVDTVFTKPVINKDGKKCSVMDALKTTAFSKVYIMLGINETGWVSSQIFQDKYGEIIDGIREINPEALIYIQGIMPVSNKVSSTHAYVTNPKIDEYNGLLRELAEEKQVYYIDTETAVAGEDGSLPSDAATDGIHLVKEYCGKWLNYLKAHTVAQ